MPETEHKIIYNRLGKTGLKVSISFGSYSLNAFLLCALCAVIMTVTLPVPVRVYLYREEERKRGGKDSIESH